MTLTLPDLLVVLQAVILSMARTLGMLMFLPFLSRQHTSVVLRGALALGLSLPVAASLWSPLVAAAPTPALYLVLVMKEAMLGTLLGMLAALPFWAVRGMGTLIDNQRGANAAQQVNPSLQADATLIGELAERGLAALLVQWGLFQTVFTVLTDSHEHWPVLALLPDLSSYQHSILSALAGMVTQALVLAGPVLALLLLVELGLAVVSTAVQGFDVYSSAMAVKTLLALLMLLLVISPVMDWSATEALRWWQEGLAETVGLRLHR
ncbi:type III secretion system export apparatus subunit SctT [Roseateles sp. SL47]|uniref:type III secretion system export apparatus subunit SctT n=1 Tax=Roseateles sp. SL47 TaxID=2995138 RepID=UPI00227134D1|nr:type III secretion system export apparatus subunit SctT [Roseateles sp. SL47]WAC75184.1 type III secretion system export apparatus subunit SctT [Roseateles sp. SL47]